MKETFQRKVDCKNAIIHSLAEDIKEAEEQYRVALRKHMVKLDEMIAFQQKRIKTLEQEYRAELDSLQAEFDEERCVKNVGPGLVVPYCLHVHRFCWKLVTYFIANNYACISQHEAEMKELNDILYTMELRFRERETEAEQEFQGMMDELKNKVN